jgi:hypothetical protein
MHRENKKDFIIDNPEIFQNKDTAVHFVNSPEIGMLRHLDNSLNKAVNNESKLPDRISQQATELPEEEQLMGFSGMSFRHLMNNLGNCPGANYLEVGTFRGSTLIPTVYGNEDVLNEIHAIDNFSEFRIEGFSPKEDLEKNLNLFLPDTKHRVQFHEEDCWQFDLSKLPKIDIYFYDGEHSAESQYRAFKYFEPVFADVFIAVVDDWAQGQVREGTRRAFEEINYDVVGSRAVIPGMRPNNANRVNNPNYFWWCGTHLAVLKKRGT